MNKQIFSYLKFVVGFQGLSLPHWRFYGYSVQQCVPSLGGLLSYVHVGDRSWTGGNSAFCCVITRSPAVSLFLSLPLFLLVGMQGSTDLGSVALLHQPVLVVCLAKDHVVLQEKLVSHTKPAPHKDTEEGGGLHKHQSKNLIISAEL